MKRFQSALLGAAVLLGAGLGWARLFAGHNVGPIPGGWLHGDVATASITMILGRNEARLQSPKDGWHGSRTNK